MTRMLVAAAVAGLALAGMQATSDARALGTGNTRPAPLVTSSRTMHPATVGRSAMSATVTPLWVSTQTQGITLSNAGLAGALAPATPLHVTLALQIQNVAQLKQLVANGVQIDQTTFNNTYAPTAVQVNAVTSYLSGQGFKNISVAPNRLLVEADGTAAIAQAAFNTNLATFSQNGRTVFANTSPAMVPQTLSDIVVSVLGLNNAVRMQTPKVQKCTVGQTLPPPAPAGSACVRFYDPATFNVAYDAGNTPAAVGSSIAIMAEGDTTGGIQDWRYNEQVFGMPQLPITVRQVGLPSPDTAGNGEWTLDLTYSQAMAGYKVGRMVIYQTTSLTDQDIALEYNHWVTEHLTNTGNSSFGGCEYGPYLDGSMVAMDQILLEGAAHGMTMFVSTGDSGGYCSVGVPNGVPAGAPLTEYPASSPYVVAVGGTDLFTATDGTYNGETGWEAGGGGISQFEYSPYWEQGVQPIGTTPAGLTFRGLPDVAADASLETGALLQQGGTAPANQYITGGTSLASPMNAGMWARLQTAHSNRLGFAPPKYYAIYSSIAVPPTATPVGTPPWIPHGPYHDIIVGSNGNPLGTAKPNYDYITGMGSIDIHKMNLSLGTPTYGPKT